MLLSLLLTRHLVDRRHIEELFLTRYQRRNVYDLAFQIDDEGNVSGSTRNEPVHQVHVGSDFTRTVGQSPRLLIGLLRSRKVTPS